MVADAARRRGARLTLASDAAAGMLRQRSSGIPAVLGDAARLPFPDRSFDLVAAGFCLSHLPDPAAALAEWRRVAGAVVASAFAPGPPHPAKVAVDDAMEALGFVTPDWYQRVKETSATHRAPRRPWAPSSTPPGSGTCWCVSGRWTSASTTPEDVVGWRLGMAHLAPWVASLPEIRRRQAIEAARDAVADLGPVVIDVLLVSGC